MAVKRIRLEGLPESEVTQLMKEVDLLKSLTHPGIVKYEGMARDSDTLSIVLESVFFLLSLRFLLLLCSAPNCFFVFFYRLVSCFVAIHYRFAENGSLGKTIKEYGKLSEELVAGYVIKILEGLHYLHKSQVRFPSSLPLSPFRFCRLGVLTR